MKKRHVIIIVFMTLIALTSCFQSFMCIHGNGRLVTETRSTGTFNKLANSTSIDVIFLAGNTSGIKIEAEENLLEYIKTDVDDNTLEISILRGINCLNFTEPAKIIVTAPELSEVSLSGSGNFICDELSGNLASVRSSGSGDYNIETISAGELEIKVSGSGNIQVKTISCTSIETRISGSGDLNIKGTAISASYLTSGSGNNYAQNLLTKSAGISISGSGNIYASVETQLNAIITGSGNVYLRGNPLIIENTSGSGRIIKY